MAHGLQQRRRSRHFVSLAPSSRVQAVFLLPAGIHTPRKNVYRLGNGLDLAPLSPKDGGKLLRKLSEHQEEADAVVTSTRIVELLGGLPLAISQMSGIIRQKHLTLKDFEEWYREDSKALHSLKVRGMLSNYQYTVGTAWAIEQMSVSAQALLKVLAVLDPDRWYERCQSARIIQ